MLDQEIITQGNRLIAEFMGYEYEERIVHTSFYEDDKPERKLVFDIGVKKYSIDKLKFHSSWDWLMPVINRIQGMDEYYDFRGKTSRQYGKENLINTKFISISWEDVLEFINWYNEQI